jgi:hypothetical protein
MTTDPESIARGLSEAQREAIVNAQKSSMSEGLWVRQKHGRPIAGELSDLGFIPARRRGFYQSYRLTELGLAVRAALKEMS